MTVRVSLITASDELPSESLKTVFLCCLGVPVTPYSP